MNLDKLRRAREIQKAGKDHIAFLVSIKDKEFDVTGQDDWNEKQWDQATHLVILKEIEEHKKVCPGCSRDLIETARSEAARLKSKAGLG